MQCSVLRLRLRRLYTGSGLGVEPRLSGWTSLPLTRPAANFTSQCCPRTPTLSEHHHATREPSVSQAGSASSGREASTWTPWYCGSCTPQSLSPVPV
eukprot:1065338-Rhodomonas_salina.1